MRKLAYLLPSFPELAQTFVLGEIVELERLGISISIYSLRRPRTDRTQAEAREVNATVYYCPSPWSGAVVQATLRMLITRPTTFCKLAWQLLNGSQGRASFASSSGCGVRANLSTYERLRGWLHTGGFFIRLKNLLFLPSAIHLAEVLTRDGVRAIHAHWASHPATVAFLVREIAGIDFTFTAHAYDIYMVDFMLKEKITQARQVITCAQANRSFLEAYCGPAPAEKISVCYHGVDLSRFKPGPARIPGELPLLIACGNLEAYKGFEYLIRACRLLRHQGVSFRCRIIGEGPRRPALEQLRDSCGLADLIELPGAVTHEELLPELGRADVCVMPSVILEGYGKRDVIPNIVVEAIAMGVPVVASAVGGMAEAVEDGVNGRLVPQANSQALAEAISTLLANPRERRRMGKAGVEIARGKFDRRANVEALARILGLEVQKPASAAGQDGTFRRRSR